MTGLIFLIILTLFAIFGPIFSPHTVTQTDYTESEPSTFVLNIGLGRMKWDVMFLLVHGTVRVFHLFVGVMAAFNRFLHWYYLWWHQRL